MYNIKFNNFVSGLKQPVTIASMGAVLVCQHTELSKKPDEINPDQNEAWVIPINKPSAAVDVYRMGNPFTDQRTQATFITGYDY